MATLTYVGGTTGSVSATYAPAAVGNLMWLMVGGSALGSNFTDSAGNYWVVQGQIAGGVPGTLYAAIAVSTASATITPGAGSYDGITLGEWTPSVPGSTYSLAAAPATGNGTSASSPSAGPISFAGSCFLVAGVAVAGVATYSPGSGWTMGPTIPFLATTHYGAALEYILSASSPQTGAMTLSPGQTWTDVCAAVAVNAPVSPPYSGGYYIETFGASGNAAPNGSALVGPVAHTADTGQTYSTVTGTTVYPGNIQGNVLYNTANAGGYFAVSGTFNINAPGMFQFIWKGGMASNNYGPGMGYRISAGNGGYTAIFFDYTGGPTLNIYRGSTNLLQFAVTAALTVGRLYQVYPSPQGTTHMLYFYDTVAQGWLTPSNTWQSTKVNCCSVMDQTYSTPGTFSLYCDYVSGTSGAPQVTGAAAGGAVFLPPTLEGDLCNQLGAQLWMRPIEGGVSPVATLQSMPSGGSWGNPGGGAPVTMLPDTPYWDTRFAAGTQYRVSATDATGTTVYSNVVAPTTTASGTITPPALSTGTNAAFVNYTNLNDTAGNQLQLHMGRIACSPTYNNMHFVCGGVITPSQGIDSSVQDVNVYGTWNLRDFTPLAAYTGTPAWTNVIGGVTYPYMQRFQIIEHPTNGYWYGFCVVGLGGSNDNFIAILRSQYPWGPYTSFSSYAPSGVNIGDHKAFKLRNGDGWIIFSTGSSSNMIKMTADWSGTTGSLYAIPAGNEGYAPWQHGWQMNFGVSEQTDWSQNPNYVVQMAAPNTTSNLTVPNTFVFPPSGSSNSWTSQSGEVGTTNANQQIWAADDWYEEGSYQSTPAWFVVNYDILDRPYLTDATSFVPLVLGSPSGGPFPFFLDPSMSGGFWDGGL